MKNQPNKPSHSLDLNYFIRLFTKHWFFIGSTLMLFIFIAFIVNQYAKPIYRVSTAVVIHEDQSSMASTTTSILQDFGFAGSQKNFSNEVVALQSTPIIEDAIKKLDFRVSYFQYNRFQTFELYKSSPFVVVINMDHPQPINASFKIEILNNEEFRMICKESDVLVYSFYSEQVVEEIPRLEVHDILHFGSSIESEHFSFKLMLNSNFQYNDMKGERYSFIINRDRDMVKMYQNRLIIQSSNLETTVADLQLKSTVPVKAIDFLNSLTESYIEKQQNQKIHASTKTIEYIDKQLNVVADSLRIAEENLQRFRSGNQVVNITFQANQIYDELKELETAKAELSIKMKYYDYIIEYFETNLEYSDLITPSGMGIEDPLLNNLIEELIQLNAEKASFVENKQDKSPYLKKINIRIDNLKNMISENISYVKRTSEMSLADLNSRIAQLSSEINKLPQTERVLLGMERTFNLNDAIYTYLLEKRAEAEITKASFQINAEILEPADVHGNGPIAPKKTENYLFAVILGIIIPVGIMHIADILKRRFSDIEEIEQAFSIPLIGQIYRNNKHSNTVVKTFPKSHIAESFRKLRIQLNYFLPKDPGIIIAISSTISQEGKSFVSLNLALSLASVGKKTILLGFDLRKPKLYSELELMELPGVSDYLSEQAELEDVLQTSNTENLDVIWAGKVPPNPAELISSSRTEELLLQLQELYDYIIIDTAPIGILSDGILLLNRADLKLFITRINHTPKKEAVRIIRELQECKVENLAYIINDTPISRNGRYGYGYYEESDSAGSRNVYNKPFGIKS